jgi:membrane protease YdiL (CAAX protease family)
MPNEPGQPPPTPDRLPLGRRLLFLAFFLVVLEFLLPTFAMAGLRESHFYDWFYGSEQPQAASEPDGKVMQTRRALWATTLAFPLWLASVGVVLGVMKAVPPAEVGLSFQGSALRSMLLGAITAAMLAPAVIALNYGATWLFQQLGFDTQEHPLTTAGQQGLLPVEWALLAFVVMVAAPLREELLFRGVIQRAFTEGGLGGHVAVFGTALIFGAVHAFAWPTPIALFVLGVGLGYLALRTRSLVAPVLVHSLFNGVSFALLLLGLSG